MAWWVTTCDKCRERNDEEKKQFRQHLFEQVHFDGYLLYLDDEPLGWCQVLQRDRLKKLVKQYKLKVDPDVWAVTCFVIEPTHRNQGLAGYLLEEVISDLKKQGIKRVQAFPKKCAGSEPGEHWTGPERMYLAAGFEVEKLLEKGSILLLEF